MEGAVYKTAARRFGRDAAEALQRLDPGAKSELTGATALHAAAALGLAGAVAELLRRGADPNDTDFRFRRPLHYAAEAGHADVVAELLKAGANPYVKDYRGWSPLDYALEEGHEAVARLLLPLSLPTEATLFAARRHPRLLAAVLERWPYLVRERQEVLALFAEEGLAEAVELMVSRAGVGVKDKAGYTPLHHAARHCHIATVSTLLEAGADPCAEGRGGETPVHSAATSGCLEALGLFLSCRRARCGPGVRDGVGRTPLHYAAAACEPEAAAFFLVAGVDVNTADMYGDTPLHLATCPEVVAVLAGARVDVLNAFGEAPLHAAARRGDASVVRALLRLGADPNQRGAGGTTPLHTAAAYRNVEAAAALLDAGADVNARDEDGRTPLHIAVSREFGVVSHELVALLLKAGADPNAPDASGRTPLQYAEEQYQLAIVQLLAAGGRRDRS